MRVEFFGIRELSFEQVQFYSVKLGDNLHTEYRNFVQRMSASLGNSKNINDLAELLKFISVIGKNADGAESRFFKKELFADRVKQPTPPTFDKNMPDPKDYGLRLFCTRLSENVVILFNGDRKTYQDVRRCPNCQEYFDEANQIAEAINTAIYYDRQIMIDGTKILFKTDDYELHIQKKLP